MATTATDPSDAQPGWMRLQGSAKNRAASIFSALYSRLISSQTEECSYCSGAFNSYPDSGPKVEAMSVAQAARCHGCGITGATLQILHPIMQAKWGSPLMFERMSSQCLDRSEVLLWAKDSKGRTRSESLEMFKWTTEPSYLTRWIDWMRKVCKFPRQDGPLPQYLDKVYHQRPISGYTGSPEAFETAFSWFAKCKASHDACRKDADVPVLPTRVVDFSSRETLRIVETHGVRGQYLCLSHRWLSDKDMFRCTHDNIKQLQENIKWESLTRTFQQAISFAQAFSAWHHKTYPDHEPIRYIWIDSICIVQDSVDDWEREAGRMCSVYENATLTVAAAVGGNGCFAVADKLFKGFDITSPLHPRTRLFLRRPLPHFGLGCAPVSNFMATDNDHPRESLDLLTRGWVLQERLLSKRFLIFGPHELLWQCLEGVDCECNFLTNQSFSTTFGSSSSSSAAEYQKAWYDRFQRDDPNNRVFPAPLKAAHFQSLSGTTHDQGHPRRWWQRVVEVYTKTNLTKASDRLPALAGLAAQFSRGDPSQRYLAGLWKGNLLEDLTWFVDEKATTKQAGSPGTSSDSPIRIPSWSWAGCNRPVQITSQTVEPTHHYVSVISTSYEAASVENPFGNCSRGTLVLRGPVYCGLISSLQNDGANHSVSNCTYYPDTGDQLTDAPQGNDRYILMSCGSAVAGSSDQDSKGWFLLHLRSTGEANEARFRRLGMLLVGATTEKGGDFTDAIVDGCFAHREVQLVELV